MNLAPRSFEQVTLCYTLVIIFPTNLDLCIYKITELESTFIENLNPKKTNVIVGCIYRHSHMDLNEFNDNYVSHLLNKLSKENETVFLLGDFNIELYEKLSPFRGC